MKKAILIFLSITMLLSAAACSSNTESSESTSSEIVQTVEPTQLVNKMTETELSRVDKHELTLLDVPEEPTTEAEPAQTEHKVSVEFSTISIEELRENVESNHDQNLITDEEYEATMEEIRIAEEKGENAYPRNPYILVDGYLVPYTIPYADPNYDGGLIAFTTSTMDENGKLKTEELSFESFEEYLDWIRKMDAEAGYSDEKIEQDVLHVQIANEALKTGDYEVLPEGTINTEDPSLYLWYEDYRSEWEYDRNAVEAIKDSIDEISIYDEELDKEFVVHVTLPPDYDKDKTYPVFFLTDGIWRFGNHPELRKLMENGEASPVILVSMWYSYSTPYDDGNTRYFDLVINRDKLLNFVTDNLMPYLTENYNIDCTNSTLYGHSDGGVFAHNALFKSDLYKNQPFGNYIIGSPALWGLYNYNDYSNISSDDVENDYGYFDRNEQLNKSLFLCAGSLEDPDYADKYNGHDTTLEGVAKLKERMESHGADLTYKLYDSHHYQYIPEMLIEFLKETYPKQ